MAIVLSAVLGSSVGASMGARPDVEALVASAHAVVRSRVIDLRSAWDPTHSRIHTAIRLEVLEQWTGDPLPREIRLTQLGGTVDDVVLAVPGLPRFVLGEDVVVFLRRTHYGNLHVVGLADGVFQVREDPVARVLVARRNGATWDRAGDAASRSAEVIPLTMLRERVRANAARSPH